MRIQSVALEDHGDIAVLRLYVVNYTVTDLQCTGRNLLQSRDHAESCGLSASGRTDEDDEFLISNLKIEILNCFKTIRINFANVFQG